MLRYDWAEVVKHKMRSVIRKYIWFETECQDCEDTDWVKRNRGERRGGGRGRSGEGDEHCGAAGI